MKFIKVYYILFFLIFCSCDKNEGIPETSIPEIQIINNIPTTSEVGDTITFEFYVYANSELNSVEFNIEDSVLITKVSDFISVKSDSIKLSYPLSCEDFGQKLNFKISVKDKNGKSNSKNISIQISDIITANYLMLKVEEIYSSAISYRDTGIVSTKYITDEYKLDEKPFKTTFNRSGLYRYEYYKIGDENSRYIIHRDENMVVKTWRGNTEETKESLSLAIVEASGISSGSAFNIPSLLMPVELGFKNILRILENIEIIESESIEGNDCYKLTGNIYNMETIYTIWIQKNNFLIRRISNNSQFDTFSTETTTDILGEINVEIDDSEFEFNPQ